MSLFRNALAWHSVNSSKDEGYVREAFVAFDLAGAVSKDDNHAGAALAANGFETPDVSAV
ncbi:hypothetical protein E8E13_000463 [Curvularia kusanoi]|uniref:Uncharacterized protein n=1 Tax=Curvularia kusanoi TaxID=90978 RepID=A0A9P4W8Q3_CURKU|nr:hypothetical protein E8E13_000463 [Curvularia kusanoi]